MGKRKPAVAEANGTPELNGTADGAPEVQTLPTTHETNGVPPEPQTGNKPVETFSVPCGGGAYVQASIWGKQIEYDGSPLTVYSVTVRKSYRDGTTQEWKNTNSFRGSEIYCVQHVLTLASTWILNARTTTASTDIPF